jgi:hypothetical protein
MQVPNEVTIVMGLTQGSRDHVMGRLSAVTCPTTASQARGQLTIMTLWQQGSHISPLLHDQNLHHDPAYFTVSNAAANGSREPVNFGA